MQRSRVNVEENRIAKIIFLYSSGITDRAGFISEKSVYLQALNLLSYHTKLL